MPSRAPCGAGEGMFGAFPRPRGQTGISPPRLLLPVEASETRQGKGLMADTAATADTPMIQDNAAGSDGVRRRDFINVAAVSAAGVGGAAVLLPLISQMNPSRDVLADASTELDVSALAPGQAIKAVFRKQPAIARALGFAEEVRLLRTISNAEADQYFRSISPTVSDDERPYPPEGLCAGMWIRRDGGTS